MEPHCNGRRRSSIADLTEELYDPVDLIFGTQLGGGTDIHKALTYCESKIIRPTDTVMVLVSYLCEGGSIAGMGKTAALAKKDLALSRSMNDG